GGDGPLLDRAAVGDAGAVGGFRLPDGAGGHLGQRAIQPDAGGADHRPGGGGDLPGVPGGSPAPRPAGPLAGATPGPGGRDERLRCSFSTSITWRCTWGPSWSGRCAASPARCWAVTWCCAA